MVLYGFIACPLVHSRLTYVPEGSVMFPAVDCHQRPELYQVHPGKFVVHKFNVENVSSHARLYLAACGGTIDTPADADLVGSN